jgi:hypothetical protein
MFEFFQNCCGLGRILKNEKMILFERFENVTFGWVFFAAETRMRRAENVETDRRGKDDQGLHFGGNVM